MIKKLILPLAALLAAFSCDNNDPEPIPVPEIEEVTISMDAGYASEVFYSLASGEMHSSPRGSWDIAFSTNPMSSTVLLNEGMGLELYTYPGGDVDAWATVDTAGMAQWTPMFNSDTSWFNEAFDRHATGHPDYGWGLYNMQNHDVVGDSLFVIRLADGSVSKLLIEKRAAMDNSFTIRYGTIGEEGVSRVISCGEYAAKNFIYFSLSSGEVIDQEPESDSWDLLFTRYHDESIPYIVTGVLTNDGRQVAEVRETVPQEADPTMADFSSHISVIGSDWKEFDIGSISYTVAADRCYFVRDAEGSLYRLVFTGTDGSTSGMISFTRELMPE